MNLRRLLLVACAAVVATCGRSEPSIIVATTTSVGNSGLLDAVLPSYPSAVRVLQVGSGRALALLESSEASAAITHAPEHEATQLKRHPTWFYRKILYNDFLIVGPPGDPAKIAGTPDAAEAMKRIIHAGARFISRGDESGTHERERQLWNAAGIDSKHQQIVTAGAGMGQTLRVASGTNSYTLTDRGTFQMSSPSLRLRDLVTGDPRLLNTYAVIVDSANEDGLRFAKWLAEGDGRSVLAGVLTSTVKGFFLWPPNHDGTRPEARPF